MLAKLKNKVTPSKIIFLLIYMIDVIIIIYFAGNNKAQYVLSKSGKSIFIGDTKNLLFGRKYISLVTTFFFFSYICLLKKMLLRKKMTLNFIAKVFFSLLLINEILFLVFTKRIY